MFLEAALSRRRDALLAATPCVLVGLPQQQYESALIAVLSSERTALLRWRAFSGENTLLLRLASHVRFLFGVYYVRPFETRLRQLLKYSTKGVVYAIIFLMNTQDTSHYSQLVAHIDFLNHHQ